MAIPRSVYAVDIWGSGVSTAGLAEGTGDPDGLCFPVGGRLLRVTWLNRPTAQVMLAMRNADGTGFYGDPRQTLAEVLERFAKLESIPIAATELEFYLINPVRSALHTVRPPNSREGRWHTGQTQVLSISVLQYFEHVFRYISTPAERRVAADATLRENGPGQYEINLNHVPDALQAADYAVPLKRIAKGVAGRRDLDATFMAKPLRRAGRLRRARPFQRLNTAETSMSGRTARPKPSCIRSANRWPIWGRAWRFAPHANSYRRLRPSEHPPTYASWGFDNRAAAVRAIAANTPAIRIEHGVAGADTNP